MKDLEKLVRAYAEGANDMLIEVQDHLRNMDDDCFRHWLNGFSVSVDHLARVGISCVNMVVQEKTNE